MHRKHQQLWIIALGWIVLLVPSSGKGQTAVSKSPNLAKPDPPVEALNPNRGARFEPVARPDPFLNPLLQRKKVDPDEEAPKGTPPAGIAGMNTSEVLLLGISMSPDGKTAAFQGTDKRVYFLHEGNHVFDGFLKAINADSVLMVRETKLRSGKVLTQEITKRLRN